MKKKSIWIFISVLIIGSLVAGSVYAFYKGNIDGVWGEIDQSEFVDIIGKIGENPLSGEWGTGNTSTKDNTLVRNTNICDGDSNGADAFDPATQWIGYPDRTYSNLGSHSATCAGTGLIISEYVESTSHGGCGFLGSISCERRVIEIFNTSSYPINLLGYQIQIFENGSPTATTTIQLDNAILAGRDVWVVEQRNYSGITYDQRESALDFDGNDVVALVKGGAGYEGAECNNWATGPTGTDPDAAPTTWQPSWWNQTGSNTDWNQVRYGIPGYDGSPYNSCADIDSAGFLLQSGFGFNGVDDGVSPGPYHENQPFVMGTLCHYNNPIYSQSDKGKLQSVPLTVTVGGIECDDGSTPDEGDSTAFTYQLRLDETTNTNVALANCPYRTYAPDEVPCADGVFISQPPPGDEFTCQLPGNVTVTYTIVTLGFMAQVDGACPEWNAADAERDFISDEGKTNCACMYGMIADEVPQAVELLYFTGEARDSVVVLDWATASETDNYGFNIYRATSLDGTQTHLNGKLIPSKVAPGSPYGAEYQFIDASAEPGVLYYYWLEDVDLDIFATLHGPVEVKID